MSYTNVTKKEISEYIAKETGMKSLEIKVIINLFFEQIKEHLKNGNNIELRGFGRFKTKKSTKRIARNPTTGESFEIPEKIRPFCQISQSIKQYVNS